MERPNHQLHSLDHPESATTPRHSSLATTAATAYSMTIHPDLSTQQNQAIWNSYHTIQKHIADIQAMLQSAIDLLQCDCKPQTLPEATTQLLPPYDHLQLINSDLPVLTDTPNANHIPTILLLFDISTIYGLLP